MTGNLGPRLAAKPLHMFWLLDVSGSMSVNGKIGALNDAMREAIDAVRATAAENPGTQVKARVMTFAHDAEWHVAEPTDIEALTWSDVAVVEGGTTELGRAVDLVTEAIREVASAGRGLPPAIVLVSDGKPTDLKRPSYGSALRALDSEPWGRKASRIAIGIGQDADMDALHRFIGHDELPPIRAESAGQLTHYLRWASTVVVDDRSRPAFSWDGDETLTEESPSAATDEGVGIGGTDDIDDERPTVVGGAAADDLPGPDEESSEPNSGEDRKRVSAEQPTEVADPGAGGDLGEAEVAPTPPSATAPQPQGGPRTDLPPPVPPSHSPSQATAPAEEAATVLPEPDAIVSADEAPTVLAEGAAVGGPGSEQTVVADPDPVEDAAEVAAETSSGVPQPEGRPRADLPPPAASPRSPGETSAAPEDAPTVLAEDPGSDATEAQGADEVETVLDDASLEVPDPSPAPSPPPRPQGTARDLPPPPGAVPPPPPPQNGEERF